MLDIFLYIALGAYVPTATVFGFFFILGGGKTSNPIDTFLSILFFPGVIVAYGLITISNLFQKN